MLLERPAVDDVAGSIEAELEEQAVGQETANLTGGMPAISTVHCLTSHQDPVILPTM